jgi:predicted hydrolase of the alpha/beta superfamily
MDFSALPDSTITIGERYEVPGLLVILHGSLLMPKIAALISAGKIDAEKLPRWIAITAPSDQDCYSPWLATSVRTEAPNFGGHGKEFLSDVVLPAVEKYAALATHTAQGTCPVTLLGYSLSGLCSLFEMQTTCRFDQYLLASPSTWFPNFVETFDTSHVRSDVRWCIASGQNEGERHPEPLRSVRQTTDALVEKLAPAAPNYQRMLDSYDHHKGLELRLQRLLNFGFGA